jgi:hypothetical protein
LAITADARTVLGAVDLDDTPADHLVHPQRIGIVDRSTAQQPVGVRLSAAVRSAIWANLTMRRPLEATRDDSTTRSHRRRTTRLPGATRASESEISWTNTSPRSP